MKTMTYAEDTYHSRDELCIAAGLSGKLLLTGQIVQFFLTWSISED